MSKADENGMVEFRVKFTATTVVLLERIAEVESRSIPGLIRQLTLERIAARSCERQLPNIIKSIIHTGKVRMENGGD
jgi:hypothetical protein